jgi:hypothetical protein
MLPELRPSDVRANEKLISQGYGDVALVPLKDGCFMAAECVLAILEAEQESHDLDDDDAESLRLARHAMRVAE